MVATGEGPVVYPVVVVEVEGITCRALLDTGQVLHMHQLHWLRD